MSERFVEILDFPYFYEHFSFQKKCQNGLEKQLENEIRVRVGIELVTVDNPNTDKKAATCILMEKE